MKQRYISSEEKQTLKKDTGKSKIGRNILLGAAAMLGGGSLTGALGVLGIPVFPYITLGVSAFLVTFAAKNVVTEIAAHFAEKAMEKEKNGRQL